MALAQFLESSASEGSLFEEASIDMMLNDQAEDERQDDPIAKRETRAVMNLKVLVAFVLLCCTVGTAYAVYHFATEAEESKFEAQFEDDAHKVLEAIGSHLDIAFGSLDALFVSMLSFAQATNQSWPFVTIPDFGIRSAKIRSMSGLIYITHLPLVTPENRLDWEAYSIEHGGWVNESMKIQENHDQYYGPVIYDFELYGVIHGDFADVPYSTSRPMLPTWQAGPVVPIYAPFNYDYLSVTRPESIYAALESKRTVISEAYGLPDKNNPLEMEEAQAWYEWYANYVPPGESSEEPLSDIYYPIIESLDEVQIDVNEINSEPLGLLAATWYWRDVIKGILSPHSMGIVVVFKNPCNPSFTYTINGPEAEYLGRGDFHDTRYDHIGIHGTLQDLDLFSKEDVRKSPNSPYSGIPLNEDYCQFNISIYPSIQREEMFTTSTPVILTVMAVVIFVFASMVFVAYDITVERRQRIVMNTAVTSRAIVSSLYPEVVRDRIVEAKATARSGPGAKRRESRRSFMFRNSGHFLAEPNRDASVARSVASDDAIQMLAGKPIAELYPETTVMFADITGFTPWSSAREPHQVFHLLETIFTAFDEVSKRCGVFKIESVGDKYVAVAGLPKAQELHAVIMARFAAMCRDKMNGLIVDLEKTLGPGTAELQVRIGLNSGATIAGVLRNEKSLFQIFGYTVNIALKMETYGLPNRIQATKKTADLLIAAGKQSWVRTRDDLINIKSKGRIKTYWIEPWNADARSLGSSVTFTMEKSDFCDPLPPHVERLVDWTVDLLEKTILEMTAQPVATSLKYESSHNDVISSAFYQERLPRSEVSDCLLLPVFHHNRDYNVPPIKPNKLKSDAKYLLRDFISAIASMHQDNSNAFEDAVNVINAVMKLMSTLIPPEEENLKGSKRGPKSRSPYSILSDPMVRFGMIFAALVHNVGDTSRHTAKKYGNKSVLEQSSVDVAWDLLTQPGYDSLRDSIFRTDTNVKRARQLLVNAVMATDTNDPELNASLDFRWRELFSASEKTPSKLYMSDEEKCSCQAKLILELVMQAAKVHHCMQHWELYLKRSRRRFNEVYAAYKKCRVSKDPSVDLYVRELTHFDTKVIPLSKKIRDCGVFGVSFHEMLDYAKSNRLDWESRGEQMVKDWIELYNSDDEDEDEDEEKIEA